MIMNWKIVVSRALLLMLGLIMICFTGMLVNTNWVHYDQSIYPQNAFEVKDKDLLTSKQQMLLVLNGHVRLNTGEVIYNNQENKVYLNEGGLEHGGHHQ